MNDHLLIIDPDLNLGTRELKKTGGRFSVWGFLVAFLGVFSLWRFFPLAFGLSCPEQTGLLFCL